MNRSSMRSNISFQPEGRLIPRRKVATKSQLLNGVGDFDMELSLAIQESLKYAQQKDQERSPHSGSCNDDRATVSDSEQQEDCSVVRGRSDQARANPNHNKATKAAAKTTDNEEMSRLKDLLLSQLELIQCQQEELNKKDRDIKSLQSAKDTLQCRLERMERRLSIMKQREESREKNGAVHPSLRPSTPPPAASHKSMSEVSRIEFKKRRRRGQSSHLSMKKRQRSTYTERASASSSRTNGLKEVSDSDNEENEDTSEDSDSGDQDEAESGSESEDSGTRSKANDLRLNSESSPVKEDVKLIDYPILQTDIMYHLYYPKHACPSSPDAKRIQEQLEVETPSWRLKPVTNMYQLEGTENITDEAYYKRHLKFEQEEKRRKRWDLQRIRELRMFEKLERQKEEEMRASQDEADIETFLPSLLDLKHIEITESVPVMAFGQPLPYICPAEFEIPWDVNNSAPSTSSSKPKSGTGLSKRH